MTDSVGAVQLGVLSLQVQQAQNTRPSQAPATQPAPQPSPEPSRGTNLDTSA